MPYRPYRRRPHCNSAFKPTELRKIVSAKLSDLDIRGAVRLLSSDAKLLSSTPETLEKLKTKHPEPHPDTVLPPPPEELGDPLICTREEVQQAIKSFRNGSGGGPDGLLPQHLKDLTAEYLGETANSLVDALMDLLNNIIFAGKVLSFMVPIFYGAGLIALSKEDGGVRPIAIGHTIRRLAGKVAMSKMKEKYPALLYPNQLGVALPGGAEIGVHTLRQFVNHAHSEDNLVANIDFRNAFNSIRRHKLLAEVKEHTPSLYRMIYQCYSTLSYLYFGDKDLLYSKEGVQQGDPLGPLLFSLGIRDLLKSCKSEVNIWYLDDGTVCGDPKTVHEDLTRILEASNPLGLSVNSGKCEIFTIPGAGREEIQSDTQRVLENIQEDMPRIRMVNKNSLLLLGAPICEEAIEGVLLEKLQDLKRMAEGLTNIDAHDAVFLLKSCYAIPKLTYFLRSAPTYRTMATLQEYDQVMKKCLEAIININLGQEAWTQSSLPVKQGGLGIRKATDLALSAFLSSAFSSAHGASALLPEDIKMENYIEVQEALDLWKAQFSEDKGQELPEDITVQTMWDQPVFELRYQELMENQTVPTEKARLIAAHSEHSSGWLTGLFQSWG